jgi:hypothetical protein
MAIGNRHENGVNTQKNVKKAVKNRPFVAKSRTRPVAD